MMINTQQPTKMSSASRPKYRCTTRHLAALDFLLNIPMTRGIEILLFHYLAFYFAYVTI